MIPSRNDVNNRTRRAFLCAFLALPAYASFAACGGHTESPALIADAGADAPTSIDDAADEHDAVIDPTMDIIDPTMDIIGPTMDVSDRDAGSECRALATSRGMTPPAGVCPADAGPPPFRRYGCLPAPQSGTCEDAYSEACVLHTYACGLSLRADGVACGPLIDSAGQCCYVTWGSCVID
jgi:hypothetical protein